MQCQIFIKNLPVKSALQETIFPCKIKIISILKLTKAATKGSSPKTAVHIINNKISKILEKHPERSPLRPKWQTDRLQLWWKWAPYGNSSSTVYLEWLLIKKSLKCLLTKIRFTIKVKILFTKFAHIYW